MSTIVKCAAMVDVPVVNYLENTLNVVGAIVSLSVASISTKGYKDTNSPTLLRLSLAFTLLSMGFIITAVVGFSGLWGIQSIVFVIPVVLLVAAGLQTTGYFFLAFSHFIKFYSFKKLGMIIPFIGPVSLLAAFNTMSVFFLLYGSLETGLSYFKQKKIQTLIVSIGLTVIALGEFTRWLAFFPDNSTLALISIILRIVGVSIFLIPVLKFALGGISQKK